MSRGYEGWDSPPRNRDTDSSPRSHRRRGSDRGDDRRQADEYGSDVYADQGDYGSDPYAGPESYRTDGYGADYRSGDTSAGYESGYQGGYGDERYADQGYGGGYADGYGGGYAANGYGGDGQEAYAARDPYASRDPYATGDYGPADPYGGPDPRVSGPHNMTDPRGSSDIHGRGRDPYDTGGGGYAGQDGYATQDGFAGGGYERGGFDQQDDDLYRWRDPQVGASDPGLSRRGRSRREDEFDAEDPRHDGVFRGFGGGDDDQRGRGRGRAQNRGRPPKQRKSHAGLVALFIVLAIFAGIGYGGYHYYSLYKARHASYVGSGYGHVLIMVKTGDTLDTISSQLLHKGVIEAIDPWASYVANKSGLQPGTYRIHIHMSPAAAYAALTGKTGQKNLINSKVTIVPGMRLTDVLPVLARESGRPLSEFVTASTNTAALGLPSYANGSLEGYLYPDTYAIAPGETALAILQTAVKEFSTKVASLNLPTAAAAVGYTPAQVITGASLLEGEVNSTYYGQVARVIDNRINQGMKLQFDSTVAYALKIHTDKLTLADRQFNSPYNTYVHTDLPVGPIDSPDVLAIEAFLHPPHGNWLYFITVDKQGTTDFTADYNQFVTWQALAKQNGV